jgi:hypothetical protein
MTNFTTPDVEAKARQDFNAFLNLAVASGSLHVTNVRVGSRQPQTEAFVRKSSAALKEMSPATAVAFEVREVKAKVHGHVGHAEATALQLSAGPGRGYLTFDADAIPAAPPGINAFATLHSLGSLALALRYASAPAFATGAGSVAIESASLTGDIPPAVAKAVDSALHQSFCDAYAIMLIASAHGNGVALTVLDQVEGLRSAGGDFSKFSLAPLSHDTQATLAVLRASLMSGGDLTRISAEDAMTHAKLAAHEGVAAWMEQCGTPHRVVTSMMQALEQLDHITHTPSLGATAGRVAPRP